MVISEWALRSDIINDAELLGRIIEQYGSDGPTVEELQKVTGKGFAMLAWEANRQGYGLQTETTITDKKEFKEHFVLWLAMEDRGWI